jgi:predicted outer membrane protein
MNKKLVATAVAVVLALTLAGGALAAGPNPTSQGFGIGQTMGNLVTRVANFIGLGVDEVRAVRVEGTTLAEVIESKGYTVEAFIAKTVSDRQAILNQMFEEGKITAEQHELCSAFNTERLVERLTTVITGGEGNAVQTHGRMQRRGK